MEDVVGFNNIVHLTYYIKLIYLKHKNYSANFGIGGCV